MLCLPIYKYTSICILLYIRVQLIWQIKEFHYRHSILSVIYHIRANAFRIFGLWRSHSRAIQSVFGVKLLFYEKFTLYWLNHLQPSKIFLIYHITLNYPNLWVNPLVKSGVLEPNNRVKSQILAFTPILTTGGGCHSNARHDNHPESCIIW